MKVLSVYYFIFKAIYYILLCILLCIKDYILYKVLILLGFRHYFINSG